MDYKCIVSSGRKSMMERRRGMQFLTGSHDFIEELRRRTFKNGESILHKVRNEDFTFRYVVENGFNNPILFQKPDGLNLKTPKFTDWASLEQQVGGEKMVEVIDVEEQDYCFISFASMMKYMKAPKRSRILNLISLECSDTSLGKLIQPPLVADDLDWVSRYWCTKKNDLNNKDVPRVQRYCLVSPANAFTDFHIDFGGTSVWYHVVKGAKVFYLIRPTLDNLNLYRNWLDSVNRLRTFFADQVDECFKLTLVPGNTLFLPTGWIHAVLTVEDSLVFGGNFLHSFNMEGQLRIYALEIKTKTPERLLYPQFEEIHWRAAQGLSKELEDFNSRSIAAPAYLINGLKAVLSCLKQWISSPRSILSEKDKECIIKNLSRQIKHADRISMTINPPKPERGSTRPRKKRILEDFVSYPSPSRKKLKKKMIQSVDHSTQNTNNEKWHVQRGDTKVVFKKLKCLTRQPSVPSSDHLLNENLPLLMENKEPETVMDSSETDSSCEITSSYNLPSSSDEPSFSNQPGPSKDSQLTQLPGYPSFRSVQLDGFRKCTRITISHERRYCLYANTNSKYDAREVSSTSEKEETIHFNSGSSRSVVVHQDEEYIYPSLILSDDEAQGYRFPNQEKDIPWNPRAKVGKVIPKTDRPCRKGKQKVAVEKGLEEAASVVGKSNYQQPKEPKKRILDKTVLKESLNPTTSQITKPATKGRRNSTVKQRLSKILKLHKRHR
ncbi:lysine-specific demethylase 7B isoform X2 [Halyomorpha halys]|uniref:lysine-specific demethylase 7B isoform X2 n=1 Tax=Halyomorpha halys TaxID=286706 RepID=UPI0006D523D4|nr:histone lysine demethylase PHF8 isoform X2 [Halyomorpha halys]XP_014277044.1 histone lysine demethylase PHF8 isoform X2 [Halyomorpha halys]XP_014277046.1 histone lysine demethylase PHF8 isoform X2 [Halyomorpha halys]